MSSLSKGNLAEAFRRCYDDPIGKQEIISCAIQLRITNELNAFCIFCCFALALTIFRVGGANAQSDPSEKLPMYGQPGIARPENLKKIDEDVIRDATFKFGNRQAASRALAEQGWASVQKRYAGHSHATIQ